eukprot:581225-Prorocentrum_minimum.AAC.3
MRHYSVNDDALPSVTVDTRRARGQRAGVYEVTTLQARSSNYARLYLRIFADPSAHQPRRRVPRVPRTTLLYGLGSTKKSSSLPPPPPCPLSGSASLDSGAWKVPIAIVQLSDDPRSYRLYIGILETVTNQ